MAFRIKPKDNKTETHISRTKIVGEIRKSQLISTYGTGALVDFPRMNSIIEGIDNWEVTLGMSNFREMQIHERNLEKILCKKFFVQPNNTKSFKYVNGIPARRFPEFYYCPECGILDKYYKIEKKKINNSDYNSDCFCASCAQTKNRDVKLLPSRFVVACRCGHIDDFPYDRWVHLEKGRCENPKLSIEVSKKISGMDGIVIKCKCGAKRSLKSIMDRGSMYQFHCFGSMPWLGKNEGNKGWYSEFEAGEFCEEELKVLQRGASNVYYSSIVSALTIPPYSSRIQRLLASDLNKIVDYFKMDEPLKTANLEYYYKTNKNIFKCDKEQFDRELEYALGLKDSGYVNLRDLIKGEYAALQEDCDDIDFLTIEAGVPDEFKALIDQIKIVGRLREVQVLNGFTRIDPSNPTAKMSRNIMDWLPGNELYGEGIFIRLNEDRVSDWEKRNFKRYVPLINRAKNNFLAEEKITENNIRYILLHTLSHLIIRELANTCGYSMTSIKEKIYSSELEEDHMCGILIYTAAPDSDGSLGGLARQGVPEKFRDTMFSMLENATWCSNDPLCMDSRDQGVNSLNYAACHACTLLPETSCELSNLLLDRGAIIGTTNDVTLGYFHQLIDG